MKSKIELNGNSIWFQYFEEPIKRTLPSPEKYCPLCNQNIKKGDMIVLILSNHQIFPNVMLHKRCMGNLTEKEVAYMLLNDYEEYTKLKNSISNNYLAWEK